MKEAREFPDPIQVEIPIINGSVMYSMMPVDALMKLRTFLDELIKWKCAGNPVHIQTLEFQITEKTK